MVQKLPKRLAWVVARHGFGVLPIVDQAHYGRGLYFTTSLNYLVALTTPAASTIPAPPTEQHQKDDELVFLLSLVVPGNAFPIVSQKGPKLTSSSASRLARDINHIILSPPPLLRLHLLKKGAAEMQRFRWVSW